MTKDQALEELAAADARIERVAAPRSLCPGRDRATKLSALGTILLGGDVPDEAVAGLVQVVDAEIASFPGSLFWDFDFLFACVLKGDTRERCRRIAELHTRFGGEPIRFRYAHDLIYGYDWAKWVAKAPGERASVGPFDLEFLSAMLARAGELAGMVAEDDETYPALESDAHRNPFSFAREPEDERRVLEDLARTRDVPVEGWRADAAPDWNRPYQRIRAERARALGVAAGAATRPIA